MLFSLEVLPAREGDCLVVHWGDTPSIAVIDGGPGTVFRKILRPRLDEIRRRRGLDTLTLDLVMVSHVDSDHIVGIRELFAELRKHEANGTPDDQRPLWADRLWHNAFTDILGDDFNSYLTQPTAIAALAAASPDADPAAVDAALAAAGLKGWIETDDAIHLAAVLAGHADGRTLRDDYKLLFDAQRIHRLNTPFQRDGEASVVMRSDEVVPPIAGLAIRVIGPSEAELVRLRKDFDKYLTREGLAVPAALVAAARDQDKSPTNLSSLVCLLDFGGKTMLLTGDAHGDSVLEGLREAGLLTPGGVLSVNLLKVQHHGSMRNASPAFFKAIQAETYVISADGKHSNPDRDTLEWLIASRKPDDDYHLVFTYPLAEIDARRRKIHEAEQLKKAPQDREAWDVQRHAVETLLEDCRQQGHAFTWSIGRWIVDLGDEKVPPSTLREPA